MVRAANVRVGVVVLMIASFLVADNLDVVAVRIEDVGAVVVRVIDLPNARLAVVDAACLEPGGVERVNRRAVLGGEGDVQAARPSVGALPDPE